MTSGHWATRRAQLRAALAIDGVLTNAQLTRRGWLKEADALALPRVTFTCRVRVTDSESGRDLTFVALEPEKLQQAPRELMHLAGLGEARARLTLAEGEVWRHLTARGAGGLGLAQQWPDAEIVQSLDASRRSDWAVEFDAGYSRRRIREKVIAAGEAGFTRLYWATSIHARTRSVLREIIMLQAQGKLPQVVRAETRYVNFWSVREPYEGRPRCHKAAGLGQVFMAAATR